ncbi:unnamed protein product [Pleuronectes platessa]|uniref:Uncharacterized protein n=1 Tax=Pleuronectes platessa TaxID=8262 RepID=A0A9N7UGC5_PLEPL|nr:unnamed protein product [Pleuronectes platessa]
MVTPGSRVRRSSEELRETVGKNHLLQTDRKPFELLPNPALEESVFTHPKPRAACLLIGEQPNPPKSNRKMAALCCSGGAVSGFVSLPGPSGQRQAAGTTSMNTNTSTRLLKRDKRADATESPSDIRSMNESTRRLTARAHQLPDSVCWHPFPCQTLTAHAHQCCRWAPVLPLPPQQETHSLTFKSADLSSPATTKQQNGIKQRRETLPQLTPRPFENKGARVGEASFSSFTFHMTEACWFEEELELSSSELRGRRSFIRRKERALDGAEGSEGINMFQLHEHLDAVYQENRSSDGLDTRKRSCSQRHPQAKKSAIAAAAWGLNGDTCNTTTRGRSARQLMLVMVSSGASDIFEWNDSRTWKRTLLSFTWRSRQNLSDTLPPLSLAEARLAQQHKYSLATGENSRGGGAKGREGGGVSGAFEQRDVRLSTRRCLRGNPPLPPPHS